jgi:hypothetical protein
MHFATIKTLYLQNQCKKYFKLKILHHNYMMVYAYKLTKNEDNIFYDFTHLKVGL